jgi:intracellular sulfur oxidation DsrE/DsrF family protein
VRYVVDIELQTADEFLDLLQRAEQLLIEGAALPVDEPKVSFILHGPVLRTLVREDYLANKALVDLAASLTAMDGIEVKACQTWMRNHGVSESQLLPFVESVPYGVAAVKAMLESENYTAF